MPNFSAARAARISPSACCMPVRPVGAIATGIATSMPTIVVRERAVVHVDRDALAQLDALEVALVGAVGALGPRAGVGVVVEHARHALLGEHAQVFDVGDDGHGRRAARGGAPMLRRVVEERQAVITGRLARRRRRVGSSVRRRAARPDRRGGRARRRERRSGAGARVRSTRFRQLPAARRISRASSVCAGSVRSRVAILKSSKRSLMPIVLRGVALARQVAGELLAQLGEDRAELGAVAHRVQVAVEGGLAADRLRLARRSRPARSSRPCEASCSQAPKLLPKCCEQERRVGGGDVADRLRCRAPRASPPPSGRCR